MFVTYLLLDSCSDESSNSLVKQRKLYEYHISLTEEVLKDKLSFENNVSNCGIVVYRSKSEDKRNSYTKYAYGLFSNPEEMKLTLEEGYVYRIESLFIQDCKDEIFVYNLGGGIIQIGKHSSDNKKATNQFIYDNQSDFNFSNPYTTIKSKSKAMADKTTDIADLVMFYGALDNIVPDKSQTIEIPMFRIGYGLKVKANDTNEENISFQIVTNVSTSSSNSFSDENPFQNYHFTLTPNQEFTKVFTEGLFTISEYPDWKERILSYEKDAIVSFTLKGNDGSEQNFDKLITFKRNTMTTLTLNLEKESSLSFKLEDTDLEDDIESIHFSSDEWEDTQMNVNL